MLIGSKIRARPSMTSNYPIGIFKFRFGNGAKLVILIGFGNISDWQILFKILASSGDQCPTVARPDPNPKFGIPGRNRTSLGDAFNITSTNNGEKRVFSKTLSVYFQMDITQQLAKNKYKKSETFTKFCSHCHEQCQTVQCQKVHFSPN